MRRSTRTRWLLVALAAAFITTAAAGAPTVLRRFDSFQVDHVSIRGTRYLAADVALAQSGITRKSNVFDDFEPWRQRLLQHPMILAARIERRLPGTILIAITETEPVALARTPDLTPVDARAKALPIDPGTADLDLPVLSMSSHQNARGDFTDRATRQVVSILALLQQRDARLYSWISQAGPMPDHGVRLELRSPAGAQALVSGEARALRLPELQIALADLAVRGELSRLQRIDARFHDQIVVALRNRN